MTVEPSNQTNLGVLPNSASAEQKDVPIYIMHIPKTAESTLISVVESLYLESEYWGHGRERGWQNVLADLQELPKFRIISGYFGAYFFKVYPRPLRYATFLRNPLTRAISHYEQVVRDSLHHFHALAHELKTFSSYIRDERTQPTVANFQLRQLGTSFDPVEIATSLTPEQAANHELERYLDTTLFPNSPDEVFRTAVARLDQLCFVGLTERFDDSFKLLCEIFDWPPPTHIPQRRTNTRQISLRDLSRSDRRLLERLNEADIELYQRAKTRFERDWTRSRFVYPQFHSFVSYAQNAEDVLLFRALRHVSKGTYVDVGANDPAGDSVTKAFYDRGWRGINIEPVTALYQALVAHRPEDVNVLAAAGANDAERMLYEIPGTGLSTLDAAVAARHRAQGFAVNESIVQVRTLRSILLEAAAAEIHFLKIDVEGWEREVLEGMDLCSIRPWIIIVEATEPNTEIPSHQRWEKLLKRNRYSCVFFDGLNRYYVASERDDLRPHFSHPVNCNDLFVRASEASATYALRHLRWAAERQAVKLRASCDRLAESQEQSKSLQTAARGLEAEYDRLAGELRRVTEREQKVALQTVALTQRAESAEASVNMLSQDYKRLRTLLADSESKLELSETDNNGLLTECERLRNSMRSSQEARAREHAEGARLMASLVERLAATERTQESLKDETHHWREQWEQQSEERRKETQSSQALVQDLSIAARCAESRAETFERECVRLQGLLADQRKAWLLEEDRSTQRSQELQARIADLAHSLSESRSANLALKATLDRERLEHQRDAATWVSSEQRLRHLESHWAVKLLVERNWRKLANEGSQRTAKRKIGVFTIASKNYLAYARVLLKSVAVHHPDYSLFLGLADRVDGCFDPKQEIFQVIQTDTIGIPRFDDMTVRYDIMEFNTAVKPFMFQWLFDNTDLDSLIYLDPDIRVYSPFHELETVLSSNASFVLTPHITQPVEDGKNPNDHHMLQSGVFNLGFAAVNRCEEARAFVDWWARRLQTQADADFARNLFTDQRWCDLAPCFLDRFQIFKHPGYNVAYWNLKERKVRHVNETWQVNGENLVFFHFSGVNVQKEDVVSKHQNRYEWTDLPDCKPLFAEYRKQLRLEGWEDTRHWSYAYGTTREGIQLPAIVRELYRRQYPMSQDFAGIGVTQTVLNACNAPAADIPADFSGQITRLMAAIYWQRRDLQAAFNLFTPDGRAAFREWYRSAADREYGIPREFVPERAEVSEHGGCSGDEVQRVVVVGSTEAGDPGKSPSRITEMAWVEDASRTWKRLPSSVKRVLAPALRELLNVRTATIAAETADQRRSAENSKSMQAPTARIEGLLDPAPVAQYLTGGRYISMLMQMIWYSRPDLQNTFDLGTPDGQEGFAGWFEASAQREYGLDGQVPCRKQDTSTGPLMWAANSPAVVPGANLVGYAYAELGMGEQVRMSAAALEATSVSFGVIDFNVGVASRQGATVDHGEVLPDNRFAANVFHVNADQMLVAYCHLGHEFFAGRYNIGYWAWELPHCPPEWLPAVKMMDEIWAPSRFVQRAFAEKADVPVEHMPLCVLLPPFKPLDRSQLGVPNGSFAFLYVFDFYSFLDRKNPFAAIRAFKRAFPDKRAQVCLLLKVMNGKEESPAWQSMMRLIDGDPRIKVVNRTMTRPEILALIAQCNCFVSLHRSEGFGRGPAEAMYLGKPVIVTNYSGNTDFTLADNSCLVDFSLIPVEEGQYPFHRDQVWADADVEHAAWYMKRLYMDERFGIELGRRAAAHIRENFGPKATGRNIECRLKTLKLA